MFPLVIKTKQNFELVNMVFDKQFQRIEEFKNQLKVILFGEPLKPIELKEGWVPFYSLDPVKQ